MANSQTAVMSDVRSFFMQFRKENRIEGLRKEELKS